MFGLQIRVHDYRIFFHPTGLCSACWSNPSTNNEDHEFITDFLKEGDNVVDIGANIGLTVIAAARSVGQTGRVIAFEPHPRIYSYLKENIALNNLRHVEVFNCAIGDKPGTLYFTDKFTDEENHIAPSAESGIRVPVVPLDDTAAREIKNIALLKLDVEGYEKFVLDGGRLTLENVGCVYFEVSDSNFGNFGYGTPEVLRRLFGAGFHLFRRNGTEKQLLPIDESYVSSAPMYENLFGVRRIDEFADRTKWQVVDTGHETKAVRTVPSN